MTGYSPEELIGRPVTELMHSDDLKDWSNVCCSNKTPNNSIRGTWRFKIANGEWRWLDCSITFFDKTPGHLRAVVISNDITERIQEEKRMKEVIRENEVYLIELRERVVNNAVIIRTFVDFLMGRFVNDDSKKIFIQAESRIIFCISLYEKFHTSPEPSGINLYSYICDIIESITIVTDDIKKNIIISRAMGEIMLNKMGSPSGACSNELISNAVKYAYTGDRKGEIEISHEHSGDKLILCVSDTGEGFSGFESNNNILSMGVSLTMKIVEMIGGELKFSTDSGHGVSFLSHRKYMNNYLDTFYSSPG
jgi:PAS domain S-box-containing protein